MNRNKKQDGSFNKKTKANSAEGIGIRTELDSEHPYHTIDQYAGDSVDEHKEIENANEHFADEELDQINNNS
ncbi:hypothetical protein GH741_14065 [Aquibacillus halophilus]|uniref:DUF4025 domain-containing protein n=1 Tax=Aquibacillus halophilus TaxID=930132 RepID=A0A6A8DJ89_9BACI|nr:hypothetical protein [Aquibacillus halophilus]MRH43799.1 hypothetical protein [Aquibacillus halophilus]